MVTRSRSKSRTVATGSPPPSYRRSSSRSIPPSRPVAAPVSAFRSPNVTIRDPAGRSRSGGRAGAAGISASGFRAAGGKAVKILGVEDDRIVGQYVKRGLDEQGYHADLVDEGL